MQRSGSQKVLLVLSIISIVFAIFGIIVSLLAIVGGAMFSAAPPSEVAESLEGSGVTQGEISAGIGIFGVVMLVTCVIGLIEGILGVRAANDNQKIMPVWILCLIGIIISLIGAIGLAFQGKLLQDPQMLGSLIVSALMFWIASNIKKQAGK